MNLAALHHRPKQNWCYLYDSNTVHVRIQAACGDLTAVTLYAADKYEFDKTLTAVPMHLLASDGLHDFWHAEVQPPNQRLQYFFKLEAAQLTCFWNEEGFMDKAPTGAAGLFEYPFLHTSDALAPPAWVKDAVFYQIFPERFANGDTTNDPPHTEAWGGKPTPYNYFGGDLQGVMDRLDHLTALGVNALYFTPLFHADTNHKYDTRNYMKIDPQFGTTETVKALVEACHARGIRVMFDAVFNHSGGQFPPFVDVMEKGEASIYKEWFHITSFPLEVVAGKPTYRTFAFEAHMPKLNTQHPEVRAYLLETARYWIEEIGIDGWRLDVANEVDHQFWRDFRAVVKQAKPDAYILGEIWNDAIMWLQGDQFDAVMNYPFTDAVLDFFAKATSTAEQFAHRIHRQLAAYPLQAHEVAFNLLDSHDTPRLLTLCAGNKERLKLAVSFQFTFLGAPCIYYGDEIGLNGGGDPDCRKCMPWEQEQQDLELFAFYQQVIGLRKQYQALRTGSFRFLFATADSPVIAYERADSLHRLIIIMNTAATAAELPPELGRQLAAVEKAGALVDARSGSGTRLMASALQAAPLAPYACLMLLQPTPDLVQKD